MTKVTIVAWMKLRRIRHIAETRAAPCSAKQMLQLAVLLQFLVSQLGRFACIRVSYCFFVSSVDAASGLHTT